MTKALISLTLTYEQHLELKSFLFPYDGKEAVSFLLCSRRNGEKKHRLLVKEIHSIPYGDCIIRSDNRVKWSTDSIAGLLEIAEKHHYSVVKVHGHPNGFPEFSNIDDISDQKLLPIIPEYTDQDYPHGSLIMLPNGKMFGRYFDGISFANFSMINVVGDDLVFWPNENVKDTSKNFTASHAQAFGQGTIDILQNLSIAVVGCSGTGSPVIEQLARLGVGEIILVDDDTCEERNINRILNSTYSDVLQKKFKVDAIGDAIESFGLGTKIVKISHNLWHPKAVKAVAQCDIIFGCVDSIDGRYLANLLSTYYMQPYFDIGVRLLAQDLEGEPSISEICGTIHYIQPGKSSLISRGLFTMKDVGDAGLKRTDPDAHGQQEKDGYIKGGDNSRPAVISVNMLAASLAVNELLARLHPYRDENNAEYSELTFSLASAEIFYEREQGACNVISRHFAKGDTLPLLGTLELSERNNDN